MVIKKKWLSLLMTIGILLLLSACGGSNESKIIGSWKLVVGDNVASYLEISEERILTREQDDEPMTIEYILTETQDDNFMVEVIDPESGVNEFIFEGFFENKNTITLLTNSNNPDGNSQLIRVDSITEEMEKDEEIAQEKAKKEQKKQALANKEAEKLQEEEEEEQQALAKEEALKMLEDERARASEEEKLREEEQVLADEEEKEEVATEEAATQATIEMNGSNEYLQKADNLDDAIMSEAKKLFAHDIESGFYGQYYSDWDDLLNEVWGELKATMPTTAFENLKRDQNDWINMKEQNFAEMPKERAYERAAGMDYQAFETKDRTYYLIENYLD